MSISSQITRITELRNRLRTKLTAMELATSTSKLEDLTEAVEDITAKSAQTYTPGTTNQTIASGQYLTGAQTISGDANLTAANIASGVSIFGVAGTHTGGTDTSDATMTSGGQMLDGITAYARGTKFTGTIETYDGTVESTLPDPVLENNLWVIISTEAQKGTAGNYWAVGDTKSVALSGTVGTLALDTTLYVYINGINHRGENGITFQGFKTAQTSGVDVCLIDSKYNTMSSDGSKYFNLNHWGSSSTPYNTNYGGWKGCDLRYDILGSTNIAPSGYGSTPTTSRVGYDAQPATTTSPVSNTLMSCLPSDLRAVMQPMTIYTDNTGNRSNTAANVNTSVDYLPLLAEFEVFGTRSYANQYEQNSQAQYAYYSAGNSKVKYIHSSTGTTANWWERSPSPDSSSAFCSVNTSGHGYKNYVSGYSIGLAPIFLV